MAMRYFSPLLLIFVVRVFTASGANLTTPEIIELGRVNGDESRRFEFAVKNVSGGALEISKIESSCNCTNVRVDGASTLAPDAQGKVVGAVNFGSMLGRHESSVTVTSRTQDGSAESSTLAIRAQVVAAAVLDKDRINFGSVDTAAGPQIAVLEVRRGNSEEEWDSIQPEENDEHLGLTVDKIAEATFRLTVHFDAQGLPVGAFEAKQKFKLLHQGRPLGYEIAVLVLARIRGPLEASPTSVYFGLVPSSTLAERSIVISSSRLDLHGLVIERQPKFGSAEIKALTPGTAEVVVHLKTEGDAHTVSDMLILTHKASKTQINIPIIGMITSG